MKPSPLLVTLTHHSTIDFVLQIRPDGVFMSLEELSNQEVDQKRPVLLVNCGSTKRSVSKSLVGDRYGF